MVGKEDQEKLIDWGAEKNIRMLSGGILSDSKPGDTVSPDDSKQQAEDHEKVK